MSLAFLIHKEERTQEPTTHPRVLKVEPAAWGPCHLIVGETDHTPGSPGLSPCRKQVQKMDDSSSNLDCFVPPAPSPKPVGLTAISQRLSCVSLQGPGAVKGGCPPGTQGWALLGPTQGSKAKFCDLRVQGLSQRLERAEREVEPQFRPQVGALTPARPGQQGAPPPAPPPPELHTMPATAVISLNVLVPPNDPRFISTINTVRTLPSA